VDAYGRKWNGRVTNLGGGTVSELRLLPPEKATGNYAKVVQRSSISSAVCALVLWCVAEAPSRFSISA
jgi:multidrug resistance efflux pump